MGTALESLVFAALFVPITILLHELGHLVAARALGFDRAKLHFSAVDPGPLHGQAAWAPGVVGLAGPAVTLILIIAAIAMHNRNRTAAWPLALAIAAASRFAVGLPYTLASLVVRAQGRHLAAPVFDEHKAATVLGWLGDLLLGLTSALALAVLVWVVLKLPRGRRLPILAALLIGTGLGWYLWMGLLGPRLLP
jgi:hypothetical protein